jgi:hypothetical protein
MESDPPPAMENMCFGTPYSNNPSKTQVRVNVSEVATGNDAGTRDMLLLGHPQELRILGTWNRRDSSVYLYLPINIFAFAHVVTAAVASFFPVSLLVSAQYMNWCCVMFGGVFIIAVVDYLARGWRHHVGPARHVN